MLSLQRACATELPTAVTGNYCFAEAYRTKLLILCMVLDRAAGPHDDNENTHFDHKADPPGVNKPPPLGGVGGGEGVY